MADSFTVNYGWTKPDVGASDDTWGDKWNANLDGIDAQIRAEADKTGVPEAPDNQTYGRAAGAWNLVVPAAGGTFTGPVGLSAGGAVTGGGLTFVGSAALSVPGPAQFTLGGGSAGWALTTDGAGTLSWSPVATGGPYVPISGATMTGPLIMQGSNMLALTSPLASGQSAILGQKAGVNRWQMMLGDYTAEGLNNVGSNFSLGAFSTTGQTLGTWLTIARADGATTFSGAGVTIAGGLACNGLLAVTNVGNLSVPGGSSGQVLSTNGSGVLSWATRLADAPSDGQFYTRQNAAWAIAPGGMTDAPNDGTAYARKSAGWAHLTHTDITDWTASLAGYALTTAIPVASSTLPLPNGVAAVGTSTAYARADHVHPSDAYPHDNRIINGDMRITQRGGSGTVAGFTVDRWRMGMNQAGKLTWAQNQSAAMALNGFPNALTFTSTSAYTALATDAFSVWQAIEADMVSDFAWGTTNAQPVTLSFWFNGPAGTYSGSVQNYAAPPTRSYPFTFNLPTTGWSKIVLVIPGDTAGTWVMSGNGGALYLNFDLGCGANLRGSAGAWQNGNFSGATGTMSVVATNGAVVQITGVKLEIGSVATPYNRQSLAKSMADCQRYYQTGWMLASSYGAAGQTYQFAVPLVVTMRAAPTVTPTSVSNTNMSSYTLSSNQSTVWNSGPATATGLTAINANYTASAEL